NFSKYGINGATIRGGYLKFNPGNWNIELSGGRSKKAVPSNSQKDEFRESAFERWAMVGKVGYEGDGSHFYLSSHYELDKSKSLNNPIGITPKENLTLTPDAKLSIFDDKVSLESQVTFSAFTRDLNSTEIPLTSTGVPSFISNLMQPHQSSRLNYAGQATASLQLDKFGMQVGYERIQPGFRSLGIGQIQDDKQKITISPSARFFDNKVSVQGNVSFGRDNLLNSRIQTQRNTGISANLKLQATDKITISSNYNLLLNSFTANSGALSSPQTAPPDQKQVSHTVMLQPSITLQGDAKTHNISLSASYFTFELSFDGEGPSVPKGSASDTYSTSATYSLTFSNGLALNSMANVLVNNSSNAESLTLGGNLGGSYTMLERKLTLSLNGGFNQNTNTTTVSNASNFQVETQQFMLSLSGNYRLTDKDFFSLSLRTRGNNVVEGGSSSYSELEANLKYQHRF
ncbi:hypothetical protein, partial [Fodinibius sp.]|uniref:hypothetical protein n=1 Tax=Fodinibius sp. TaxID=1872440 RepID=UPI002ACD54E6